MLYDRRDTVYSSGPNNWATSIVRSYTPAVLISYNSQRVSWTIKVARAHVYARIYIRWLTRVNVTWALFPIYFAGTQIIRDTPAFMSIYRSTDKECL